MKKKITIIGVGNMGRAMALGLLRSGTVSARNLALCDRSVSKLGDLKKSGVQVSREARKTVKRADIVILAVKPHAIAEVLQIIRTTLSKRALLISVAAGISVRDLERFSSRAQPIIRVMPNMCALVGESMSVWVRNKNVSPSQALTVKKILSSIGQEEELRSDAEIDAATALTGSGPAYVFYLAEMLMLEAKKLRFSAKISEMLIRRMIYGSAVMLQREKRSVATLRAAVTSKGGITAAAFEVFERLGLAKILHKGIAAAVKRAKTLRP